MKVEWGLEIVRVVIVNSEFKVVAGDGEDEVVTDDSRVKWWLVMEKMKW